MKEERFAILFFCSVLIWWMAACSDETREEAVGGSDQGDTTAIAGQGNACDMTSNGDTDLDGGPDSTVCDANGDLFRFGVSSYGALRQWAIDANEIYGADFKYLYVYILDGGMENPDDFRDWYIVPFIEAAESIGATPFFTFYQLLDIGRRHGHSGSEADVVKGCIEDGSCMSDYFSNFIWFLQILDEQAPDAIVHVEPDSWGFMMWAMGIEGNDDPRSVTVQVTGSGFDDVSGFDDNAAGLGRALLSLRNRYAPDVRMGWHASNFRVGTRPEVVTAFFAEMGPWDLLVGESMHNETDPATWWMPWDETMTETNLTWISTVTEAADLPMILWQLPIGNHDFHLVGTDGDRTLLEEHAEAGVIAALFEHIAHNGEDDPDLIRASGDFGVVPPADSGAGGTAGDMRDRMAAYTENPLFLPSAAPCPPSGS